MPRLPRIYTLIAAFALLSPLVACGEDDPKGPQGGQGGDGGQTAGEGGAGGGAGEGGGGGELVGDPPCYGPMASIGAIDFVECTEPGSEGPIDCAVADVPIDWCDEDSLRISFYFRRFPHRAEASKGQYWYLPGGPGDSGYDRGIRVNELRDLGFDVLVPDYRGVGQSTSLTCAYGDEGVVVGACLEELKNLWGPYLQYFSTTGAALDIGHVIEAIREPDEDVFVMGGSYGTYVTNRYLHFFPDQATAAIMDGICHGSICEIWMDRNRDRVVRDVLDYCGTDPFCSSKLTTDPVAWLTELMADIEQGHCSGPFGNKTATNLANVLTDKVRNRKTIAESFAFAYRLRRCDPADQAALQHYAAGPGASVMLNDHHLRKSSYLYFHIFLNEFYPEGLTVESAIAERDQLLLPGDSTVSFARNRAIWPWPFYSTPEELRSWAKTDIPLLLLNGTLDTQTPIALLDDIEEAFDGPNQHFFPIPWGPHSSVYGAEEGKPLAETCVGGMLIDFLFDPTATPDASCLESFPPPEFDRSEAYARAAFGTADLWENEEPGSDE